MTQGWGKVFLGVTYLHPRGHMLGVGSLRATLAVTTSKTRVLVFDPVNVPVTLRTLLNDPYGIK